jgi:hypothetical protein
MLVSSEYPPSSEKLRSSSESKDFEIEVVMKQLATLELATIFIFIIIKTIVLSKSIVLNL